MTFLDKCLQISVFRRGVAPKTTLPATKTILDLAPGQSARVAGFSSGLTSDRRSLLRAHGLVPGYSIRLLQHSPVSVIQIEHAEIAFEHELAGEILVSEDPHI